MHVSPRKGVGEGCSKRRDARRVSSSRLPGRRLFRGAAAHARRVPSVARPGPARHRGTPPQVRARGCARCRSSNFSDGGRQRGHRAEAGGGGDAPSSFHTFEPGTRSVFEERNGNARFLPPRWGRGGREEKWYSRTFSCFVLF